MGMFDYIADHVLCHACGEVLEGLQSKSGNCDLQQLSLEELYMQSDGEAVFYGDCTNCNLWNEYVVIPPTKEYGYKSTWEEPQE